MRSPLLILPLLVVAAPVAAGDIPAPTGEAIVSPDAKLELLFTRTADLEGGLTEGPAVAPDGSIYFSDIPFGEQPGMILRFDPKTKKSTVFTDDSGKSNGLIFNRKGQLCACEGANIGGRQISRWNVKTGKKKVLADRFMGKRFNSPNDICLDAKGRIYFSDPRYVGKEPRELDLHSVYRVDAKGKVVRVTSEVTKPNGLVITPDGKTLVVANTDNGTDQIDPTKPAPKQGPMKIFAFPLGEDGLPNGPRRTLVDFGDKPGCDGMTVDTEGRIYLTVRQPSRPGVMVIDGTGKELAFIPTGPADQETGVGKPAVGLPSNVEFGIGEEINVLYVTVDVSLYRIPLKSKGYHVQYRK